MSLNMASLLNQPTNVKQATVPWVILGFAAAVLVTHWSAEPAISESASSAAYVATRTVSPLWSTTIAERRHMPVTARAQSTQRPGPQSSGVIRASENQTEESAFHFANVLGLLAVLSGAMVYAFRRITARSTESAAPQISREWGTPTGMSRRTAFQAATVSMMGLPLVARAAEESGQALQLQETVVAVESSKTKEKVEEAERGKLEEPSKTREALKPEETGKPKVTDRVYFKVRIARPDGASPDEKPFAGTVVFGLYGEEAPLSTAKFLKYVTNSRPNYSVSTFFRMEPGVLLDAGRINQLEVVDLAGTTSLRYGEQVLPASMAVMAVDVNDLKHDRRGLLTHAKTEVTGEFSITLDPDSLLDDTNVVFGEVLEGQEFLDRVELVPVLNDAEPGPFAGWLRAQKKGMRQLARVIGDDRVKKVYENKLLRRVDVATCGILESSRDLAALPVSMFATSGLRFPANGRRASAVSPLAMAPGPSPEPLEAGCRVRVCKPLTLHHIVKANGPVQVEGCTGVLVEQITTYKGSTITANYPCKVRLEVDIPGLGIQNVVCHLERSEIELI